MRLFANLPHKLWREIIATATYLYNQTLRISNSWKSPYELFHTYVFDKKEVWTKKTSTTSPKSIRMQSVCAHKVKKQLPIPSQILKTWQKSTCWLFCWLRVNKHLSNVDIIQEKGDLDSRRDFQWRQSMRWDANLAYTQWDKGNRRGN